MVAVNVDVKVLEHDEFSTLLTLISPRATIVLMFSKFTHLHMSSAKLAQGCSLRTHGCLVFL